MSLRFFIEGMGALVSRRPETQLVVSSCCCVIAALESQMNCARHVVTFLSVLRVSRAPLGQSSAPLGATRDRLVSSGTSAAFLMRMVKCLASRDRIPRGEIPCEISRSDALLTYDHPPSCCVRSLLKLKREIAVRRLSPFAFALSLACIFLSFSKAHGQTFPRTSDGRPDLQGQWTMRTLTPFFRPDGVRVSFVERNEEAAMIDLIMAQRVAAERLDPGTSEPDGDALAIVDGQRRTSAIISPSNGQMALTAAGEARLRSRRDGVDGPEARPVNERCIADAGRAPYRVMSGEMYFEIIQTPDHLVIHKEGMDPPRIFALTETPAGPLGPSWTGSSTAHWDGDVFVIETTGFRPDDPNRRISGPGAAGFPVAPGTRITEWLIPASADAILYRYKIDDPTLYLAPLVVELPMARTSENLFESACHEGNASLANTLRGARRAK